MSGVLVGFAIIGVVIATGYGVGRAALLGPHAQFVMSRLAFFVLMPCLLFHTIATADAATLFSPMLAVSALSALSVAVVTATVFALVLRRPLTTTTVGALAASYSNANNIGLPVAVYVLGQATAVVPVIMLQLVVMAPIALTVLDAATASGGGWRRRVLGPVSNPLIIASLLGLVCSVTGLTLPDPVLEPFVLVGGAAVPVVLLSFGMSLHGSAPLRDPAIRLDVLLATGGKLLVMPVVAFLLARYAFGLDPAHVFVLTVLAGLPSAQNVFNYAQRYDAAVPVARDVVLLSTVGSVPVLVAIAALLHP
ncbi:AEC family transporter [Curtobacterium sp. MCJR17_055]|uniref:AEC family transporter n=1 Tax=unclassified Curtobacterium TaxID=257496 RepID=UPI000D8486A1|nr:MULTISPECIES: AEC family transporter [unclassified Curtobacterium]PYY33886.1 AEC family transporter [Curtobacterium sp. MCBD17_029]PYY58923.1 AEC family transporter [Curtobacterium sp. MCJR17_055]PYY59914.1 AEC family transporter [Curtobacterium sp. MCPF17_015]